MDETGALPKILLVDDTPANIKLLADILRGESSLVVATNGSDALDLAGREQPDLVLLDVMMPDMDGYEVCKRLKRSPATRDIPVIFVTAMTDVEDETRGFDVGAVDFIAKPISPPVVLSRVRSAVALRRKSRELAELSGKLARYLSPQLYESIFQGRRDARIGSHRKKLTIFFSDIVGFTSTTERLESEVMNELLNSYLERMSQIVMRHGGTIDKFMGDAIMAFFGDPETRGDKEDALACVRMAMEMREALGGFQREWYERGVETPFRVRVGINTGYCTVGNFGSAERMEYTIIGGQVNVASRLESAAEPDQILISHETWSLVRDEVYCIKKEALELKGIPYPIQTYQVVDALDTVRGADYEHPLRDLMEDAARVTAATPLREAAAMLGNGTACLLAVDEQGALAGLVTASGLARMACGSLAGLDGVVADAMDGSPLALEPMTPLGLAARQAAGRAPRAQSDPLVVMDGGEPLGVVRVGPLLARLADLYEKGACPEDEGGAT